MEVVKISFWLRQQEHQAMNIQTHVQGITHVLARMPPGSPSLNANKLDMWLSTNCERLVTMMIGAKGFDDLRR